MSLRAREIVYHGQLAGKRLIGELHLTESDLTALVADYHALPHRERANYPLARAIALVFCGVYGYKSGNFWDQAAKRLPELGDTNRQRRWTDAFNKTIRERGLEPFADFPASALPYVSRILAHGGVPDGCLPDFFALVRLAISRPEWAALSAADLIAEWRARDFRFLPSCDLPVQRFLIFGGEIARDFLQRAIDMAVAVHNAGGVPEAAEVGLPARVVAGFNAITDGGVGGPPVPNLAGRLAAPVIRYDPWQPDGLTLDLPAQPTAGLWTVTAENPAAPVYARVRPEPGGGARQYILDTPAARYTVAYDTGAGEPARWTFPGMAGARPFLAFDVASGKLLRAIDALPARSLAIVMPRAYTDVTDEQGASLVWEKFPSLVGGWSGFRGVAVDTAASRSVRIAGSGMPTIGPVAVSADRADRLRPTTDITTRAIPGVTAGEEALPVLPSLPVLRIPITSDEVAQWTVHIATKPDTGRVATDDARHPRALSALETTREDGAIVVSLGQPALVPPGTFGALIATARGPLGRDARVAFALIPGLAVGGVDAFAALRAGGTAGVTLRFSAGRPFRIETRANAAVVAEAGLSGAARTEHLVRVTAGTAALAVSVSGAPAPIPLTVAVPWPRWAVQGIGERAALQWSDRSITIGRDELVNAPAAALRVDGLGVTRGPNREIAGRVALTIDGQTEDADIRGVGAWLPLDRFSTTIRASQAATLRATLDAWDRTDRRVLTNVPVIEITRALSVSGLAVSDMVTEGENGEARRAVTATWTEQYPLAHRHLRLWPLAQPWARPATFPIPTDAGGQFAAVASIGELPAGPYRAEIIVLDPWAMAETTPAPPRAPDRGADGPVRDVVLGNANERTARVARLPDDALGALTRFLITGEAPHLRRLPDLLATDAVGPALRVLLAILEQERHGAADDNAIRVAREALREAIVIHPGCAAALADLLAAGTDAVSFAHLIGALGLSLTPPCAVASLLAPLGEGERAAIEAAWPLALTAETNAAQGVADRYARAEELLGAAGLGALFSPPTDDQPLRWHAWATSTACDRVVTQFDVAHFENTGQGSFFWNHSRTVATLLRFAAHFTTPVRVLDGEYVIAAMLEWLIGAKCDPAHARTDRIRAWVEREYDRCAAALFALERARSTLAAGAQIAVQIAAARRVPDAWATQTDDQRWLLMYPFVAGVTALMQRLIARGAGAADAVAFTDDYWRDNGRIAALTGTSLNQYDLCVFDLLILADTA